MAERVPREGESIFGPRAKPDYKINPETGCWEWQKGLSRQGYASGYVHRRYWEAANGAIPDGWHIHHECRNTICLNPDHLRAIAPTDHFLHHLEERGLTLEDVREIMELGRSAKYSVWDVAERFGISHVCVYLYWNGKSYPALLGGPIICDRDRPVCRRPGCDLTVPPHRSRHAVYCSPECQKNKRSRVPRRLQEAA